MRLASSLIFLIYVMLYGELGRAETCSVAYQNSPPEINTCASDERVTLSFVGDVLIHGRLQRQGLSHGFSSLWQEVIPLFKEVDIAVANLEGPVAPTIDRNGRVVDYPGPVYDNVVFTSYPLFNYHPNLLQALQSSGIDFLSTANNHALDRFSLGADTTIDLLEQFGIAYSGTVRSNNPRDFTTLTDTDLGQIAWISCTFSTNGIIDTDEQVLYCYRDREYILHEVRRLNESHDIVAVVVLTHWGVEYASNPSLQERDLAKDLASAGATLVVGTHPHVVQPWEFVPQSNNIVPIVYSTGNFVSGQLGLERETGIFVRVEMCRQNLSGDLADNLRPTLVVSEIGWVAMRMQMGGALEVQPIFEGELREGLTNARNHVESLIPNHGLYPSQYCENLSNQDNFSIQ